MHFYPPETSVFHQINTSLDINAQQLQSSEELEPQKSLTAPPTVQRDSIILGSF